MFAYGDSIKSDGEAVSAMRSGLQTLLVTL
jgi:hypothetical protein